MLFLCALPFRHARDGNIHGAMITENLPKSHTWKMTDGIPETTHYATQLFIDGPKGAQGYGLLTVLVDTLSHS
jgi:hypothetical protein